MSIHNRKKYIIGFFVVVILIVGMGIYVALKPNNEKSKNNVENIQPQYTVRQACDFFTEDDARKVLGAEVEKKSTDSMNRLGAVAGEIDPVTVTTCSYSMVGEADRQVTVVVRSSTPEQAKADFDSMRLDNVTGLEGYGEEGYEYTMKSISGPEEYGVRLLNKENVIIVAGTPDEAKELKNAAKAAMDRL